MGYEFLALAVDGGGTSTRAVLSDAHGNVLGVGVAGAGNPVSAGVEGATEHVLQAVHAALGDHPLARVRILTLAMAGMRASAADTWLTEPLRSRGFQGDFHVESDLLALFFSGSAASFGYAAVSGTGACVIRVRDGRLELTRDGVGWLLGDRGSGFWIGREVVLAAVAELDGLGPRTALTPAVLDHFGVGSEAPALEGRRGELGSVIEAVYADRPVALARLAPLAFDTADAVARGILERAGAQLAASVQSILDGPGPLVLGGGVLARGGVVRDAMVSALGQNAAELELHPVADGMVGATFLALRHAGAEPDEQTRQRLAEGIARARA